MSQNSNLPPPQMQTHIQHAAGDMICTAHVQLLKYSEEVTRGKTRQVLNVDNFIDTSNSEGRFEFSEWVRAYGKYLDEQLEVYNQISWYQVRVCKMTLKIRFSGIMCVCKNEMQNEISWYQVRV